MTRLTFTIIAALAALAPDAAAAPCATFTEARASHRTEYLVYRLEHRKPGARKCWFAPAKSSRSIVKKHSRTLAGGDAETVSSEPKAPGLHAASIAPGPREIFNRFDDAFSTINHFTTMPWHDDLWLRMQTYWLQESGAFGVPVWVMSARWP